MISIKLFKVVAKIENMSLFSGATAVQSRPKSHTFTVNLAVFAPRQDCGQNPCKGLFIYTFIFFLWKKAKAVDHLITRSMWLRKEYMSTLIVITPEDQILLVLSLKIPEKG